SGLSTLDTLGPLRKSKFHPRPANLSHSPNLAARHQDYGLHKGKGSRLSTIQRTTGELSASLDQAQCRIRRSGKTAEDRSKLRNLPNRYRDFREQWPDHARDLTIGSGADRRFDSYFQGRQEAYRLRRRP